MRTMLVLAVALSACSHKADVDAEHAKKLLVDRNWIDRMPETKDDRLHVYRFVPSMGGGVFQDRTLYKGTFELFKFEAGQGQIRFDLPETGDKVTSAFSIEPVDGPKPFDLKLTISDDPRGPHVYYGIKAEKDVDGSLLEQRLHAE
jgi:hypothetical protein